ncbi:MAG: hypothetical protein ACREDG_07140 [Methylocella sp.]
MGGGDFALQTVERLVEVFNLARQNLHGRPGGVRKCWIIFGQLDKLVDAANPFRDNNAELRKMAAQGVDAHRLLFDEQLARLVEHQS